jgi:hypothetical protein
MVTPQQDVNGQKAQDGSADSEAGSFGGRGNRKEPSFEMMDYVFTEDAISWRLSGIKVSRKPAMNDQMSNFASSCPVSVGGTGWLAEGHPILALGNRGHGGTFE